MLKHFALVATIAMAMVAPTAAHACPWGGKEPHYVAFRGGALEVDDERYRSTDDIASVLQTCGTGVTPKSVEDWKLHRTTAIVNSVLVVTAIGAIESWATAAEARDKMQARIDAHVPLNVSREARRAFLTVHAAPSAARESVARSLLGTVAADDRAALLALAAPGDEGVEQRLKLLGEARGLAESDGVRGTLTDWIHDAEVTWARRRLPKREVGCAEFFGYDSEVRVALQPDVVELGRRSPALQGRSYRVHVVEVGEAMAILCRSDPDLPVQDAYTMGVLITNSQSAGERLVRCGVAAAGDAICGSLTAGWGPAGPALCGLLSGGPRAATVDAAMSMAGYSKNENIRAWAGAIESGLSAVDFLGCLAE